MDLIGSLMSRLRQLYYKLRGVQFGGNCWLRAIEIPKNHSRIHLAAGAALDRGCTLLVMESGALSIGPQCYVNRNTMFDVSQQLEIGARTMIGPFCYLTDHDHDVTSPNRGPLVSAPTIIGEDCWLGAHVTVLKGVTIGAGTVVGAGSVVTKSLPPRCIAVGNPARVVKSPPS